MSGAPSKARVGLVEHVRSPRCPPAVCWCRAETSPPGSRRRERAKRPAADGPVGRAALDRTLGTNDPAADRPGGRRIDGQIHDRRRTVHGAVDLGQAVRAHSASSVTGWTSPTSGAPWSEADPLDADVLLVDGTVAVVRAVRPDDREALLALHDGASETSQRMRFFAVGRQVGHDYVEHLFDARAAHGREPGGDGPRPDRRARHGRAGLGRRGRGRVPGRRGAARARARQPPAGAPRRRLPRPRHPPLRRRGARREPRDARGLPRRRLRGHPRERRRDRPRRAGHRRLRRAPSPRPTSARATPRPGRSRPCSTPAASR